MRLASEPLGVGDAMLSLMLPPAAAAAATSCAVGEEKDKCCKENYILISKNAKMHHRAAPVFAVEETPGTARFGRRVRLVEEVVAHGQWRAESGRRRGAAASRAVS